MYNAIWCVVAVQGHPRSMISVPIESAYGLPVSDLDSILGLILHRFGDTAISIIENVYFFPLPHI